jgi:hypothetical protein
MLDLKSTLTKLLILGGKLMSTVFDCWLKTKLLKTVNILKLLIWVFHMKYKNLWWAKSYFFKQLKDQIFLVWKVYFWVWRHEMGIKVSKVDDGCMQLMLSLQFFSKHCLDFASRNEVSVCIPNFNFKCAEH